MNKRIFIILFALVSVLVQAQQNAKYLAGAVPEIDGKIVFSRTITVNNNISSKDLFQLMDKWAKDNYTSDSDSKNRVLLSDEADLSIACLGDNKLVFKKNAFVLDQASMIYQLILNIEKGKCEAVIRNIKYDYPSESKSLLPAEDVISDETALDQKKGKLYKRFDKFRIHTVDSVNGIFNSIDLYLNGRQTTGAAQVIVKESQNSQPIQYSNVAEPVLSPSIRESVAAIPSVSSSSVVGYKQVQADKIPGNIIKLLSDWMLITSGTSENLNVMTASWGGLGTFWEKPVAFCFLNPTRYSVQTMDKGDVYTLSFYTEAYKDALKYCGTTSGRTTDKIKGSGLTPIELPSGATAFSEAWMILECKKIVAQPISPDAVVVKPTDGDWSKNGYHKMYIGEILNVWVK